MKKLWLVSALSFLLILLAGCNNKPVEAPEVVEEENIVEVVEEENVEEEIVEEVGEEVIDWERWNLLAFNWKEVDWDYDMTITNDGKLYTKFCNDMWWDITFDWDENEWTIYVSLVQNLMACEWESMDLENAFQLDWSSYTTIANEDWGKTMIIITLNWDKFNWRTN